MSSEKWYKIWNPEASCGMIGRFGWTQTLVPICVRCVVPSSGSYVIKSPFVFNEGCTLWNVVGSFIYHCAVAISAIGMCAHKRLKKAETDRLWCWLPNLFLSSILIPFYLDNCRRNSLAPNLWKIRRFVYVHSSNESLLILLRSAFVCLMITA